VNNLVKSLVEGTEKEDPAGLYVFIPHATLQQHNYVLKNTVYIEVTVG
jgi:mannitol/fructose-specific phosphotransferase system IIA component